MKNITITITDSDGNVTFETSTKAMQTEWDNDPHFVTGGSIVKPDDLVEAVAEEIHGKFYATNGDWFDKANHVPPVPSTLLVLDDGKTVRHIN